jgi:tetratricopeptide (TPR) repeat protein
MLLDNLKPKSLKTPDDIKTVIHLNDIDKNIETNGLPDNIKKLVKEVQQKEDIPNSKNKNTLTLYNLRNLCLNSLIFGDEFKDVLKANKKYAIKFTAPINEIYYDAYGKLYNEIEKYLDKSYEKYPIKLEIIREDNNHILYIDDHIHVNNNGHYIIASSIEYIITILKNHHFIDNKEIEIIDKNYSTLYKKNKVNKFKIDNDGRLVIQINTANCISCRFNNICSTTEKTTNK